MLKFVAFLFLCINCLSKSENVVYNINNKKILHKVSDKFLSISLDPAVLLVGANLSDVSLLLAKNLRPAYIQLAGPSTPFVKYLDHQEEETFPHIDQGHYVHITPSMWFGINEWFTLAGLTPVFAINDKEREKGVWNPKSILPFLEISDKFGVKCYWQLGYDSSNKTAIQYVEDLNILRQTINDFSKQKETWKIAGSDFSSCDPNNIDSHTFDAYIRDLDENVNAIMWKGQTNPKGNLGLTKASLWTSVPKDVSPVTFSTAMKYAIKVGEAATLQYDVIFREPRLLELTHITPVYWFSYLHKKLMGSNVLEIKSTNQNSILQIFTHCTKRQSNLIRSGAITVMAINNGSETSTANLRLGNFLLEKTMEIQSYFLTASDISKSYVFLNDKPLTMSMLQKPETLLTPKLRRINIRPQILLEVPAQTIAFFVLAGAKYSLCISNEEDLTGILEDINDDSKASLSREHLTYIEDRRENVDSLRDRMFNGEKITLQNIKGNILKEMEQDKSYYNKIMGKPQPNTNILSKTNTNNEDNKREILHKHLRAFIEKSKSDIINKAKPSHNRASVNNMHLTIKEIEDILKRRARDKAAARNIKLTSSELDLLVDKATLKIPKHFVSKRGINKILLEEKANFHKSNSFTQEMYEEIAKEMKIFPKHKYRISHKNRLLKRSINTQLLHLKALVEENKKYLNKNNDKVNKSFSKVKRDINLDLLKKRTQSQFDKGKVIVQPNFDHRKSHIWTEEHKHEPTSLDGESSHELFDDVMRFEEKALKDIEEGKNPLVDLDALDKLFKKSKNRHTTLFEKRFSNPLHLDQSIKQPKTGSNLESFNPLEYFQSLQPRSEGFGPVAHQTHKQTPALDDKLGHLFAKSKQGQDKDMMEWSALKSVLNQKNEQAKSLYGGLDDFNFSGELDYGFYRKKRDLKTISKAKMRSLKLNVNNEIRKLKLQLKEKKLKYLEEKIKSKGIHNKQPKTNIQIIPKYDLDDLAVSPDTKKLTLEQILAKADSRENIIEQKKTKRSLMQNELNNVFGQYTPLTTGLKSWNPADILNLNKNFFTTLPIYSWVQDQNRRLQYEINKNKLLSQLGLRKKRHIDIDENNKQDFEQNEIVDEEFKANGEYDDKEQRVKGTHIENIAQVETEPNLVTTTIGNIEHIIESTQKIPTPEKLTYLEKILGKQKARPVENFFNDVKEKFNDMNDKVTGFFKNPF